MYTNAIYNNIDAGTRVQVYYITSILTLPDNILTDPRADYSMLENTLN